MYQDELANCVLCFKREEDYIYLFVHCPLCPCNFGHPGDTIGGCCSLDSFLGLSPARQLGMKQGGRGGTHSVMVIMAISK